jgi:hypothetical protein
MDHAPAIDVQETRTGGQHVTTADRGGRGAEMPVNMDGLQDPQLPVCVQPRTVQPPGQDVHP